MIASQPACIKLGAFQASHQWRQLRFPRSRRAEAEGEDGRVTAIGSPNPPPYVSGYEVGSLRYG